jgi:hypothetical protein
MLGWLGKIVGFVTFVCFAVEKKVKIRPRLGRTNPEGHLAGLLQFSPTLHASQTLSVYRPKVHHDFLISQFRTFGVSPPAA